jgi:hypothetical protein
VPQLILCPGNAAGGDVFYRFEKLAFDERRVWIRKDHPQAVLFRGIADNDVGRLKVVLFFFDPLRES